MSSPIFVGDYTPHSDRIYGKYVAVDVPKPIQHKFIDFYLASDYFFGYEPRFGAMMIKFYFKFHNDYIPLEIYFRRTKDKKKYYAERPITKARIQEAISKYRKKIFLMEKLIFDLRTFYNNQHPIKGLKENYNEKSMVKWFNTNTIKMNFWEGYNKETVLEFLDSRNDITYTFKKQKFYIKFKKK